MPQDREYKASEIVEELKRYGNNEEKQKQFIASLTVEELTSSFQLACLSDTGEEICLFLLNELPLTTKRQELRKYYLCELGYHLPLFSLVLGRFSYKGLRQLMEILDSPWDLCRSDMESEPFYQDQLDSNSHLTGSEKETLKREFSEARYFLHNIHEAISQNPDRFLEYVSKYMKNFPKRDHEWAMEWEMQLEYAVRNCDKNSPIYGPLLAYLSQNRRYILNRNSFIKYCHKLFSDLSKLRDTTSITDPDSLVTVAEIYMTLGSPLKEMKEEEFATKLNELRTSFETIASKNCNILYLEGLQIYKRLSKSGHPGATQVLLKELFPTLDSIDQSPQIVVPETKRTPTLFSAAPAAQDITEKKYEEVTKQLQQKVDQFRKMDWYALSYQFAKAAELKLKPTSIDWGQLQQFGSLKHQIERLKMGSEKQQALLKELCSTLKNISAVRSRPLGVFSFLILWSDDPYATWLKNTAEIAQRCQSKYHTALFPVSEVRIEISPSGART